MAHTRKKLRFCLVGFFRLKFGNFKGGLSLFTFADIMPDTVNVTMPFQWNSRKWNVNRKYGSIFLCDPIQICGAPFDKPYLSYDWLFQRKLSHLVGKVGRSWMGGCLKARLWNYIQEFVPRPDWLVKTVSSITHIGSSDFSNNNRYFSSLAIRLYSTLLPII